MPRNETELLRQDDLSGDEWCVTIGHAFDVAEVLHHRRYTDRYAQIRADDALERWQFRHSPVSDTDKCSALAGWPCSEYRRWSTPKLLRTFKILNRYLDVLKRAGRDY